MALLDIYHVYVYVWVCCALVHKQVYWIRTNLQRITGAPEADQKCGGKHTVASHICIAKN